MISLGMFIRARKSENDDLQAKDIERIKPFPFSMQFRAASCSVLVSLLIWSKKKNQEKTIRKVDNTWRKTNEKEEERVCLNEGKTKTEKNRKTSTNERDVSRVRVCKEIVLYYALSDLSTTNMNRRTSINQRNGSHRIGVSFSISSCCSKYINSHTHTQIDWFYSTRTVGGNQQSRDKLVSECAQDWERETFCVKFDTPEKTRTKSNQRRRWRRFV